MQDEKQIEIFRTEILQKITQEQYDELLAMAPETNVLIFFKTLMFSFGDGEVLPFVIMKHFFETKSNNITLYVDTYRMLMILERPFSDMLAANNEAEIQALHDQLQVEYKPQIDAEIAKRFTSAVAPFSRLSGTFRECSFELISTLEELNAEGKDMNHCIASYYNIIINRQYIGLRFRNQKTSERLTLGLIRSSETQLVFNQLKAWGNYPASLESRQVVYDFCRVNGIQCDPNEVDLEGVQIK